MKQLRAYAPKIIPLLLNRKVLSTAKQRNELLEVICDFLKLFKDDISIIETLLRSLDGLNGVLKESELLTLLNTLLLWSESTLCTYVQAIISLIDSYSPFTKRNKAHQTKQPFEEYEEVRSRLESSFDHSDSSFSVAHSRLNNDNTRSSNENSRLNNENSRFLNESSILSNKSNQRSNEISRISNENSSFSNEYNRTGNENSQLGMDRSRFSNEPSFVKSEHTQLSNGKSWNRGKMEEFNYCPIVFLFLFLFFSLFLVAFVSWKAPKQSTPVSTEEVYVSPNFDEWAQPSSSEIPEIGLFFTETQSQQESAQVDETLTKPPPPINEFRDLIKPDHSSTTRIREEADAFIIEEVSETEPPSSSSSSSSSSTSSSGNSGNSGNNAGSETREDLVEISFASDGLSLNVLLLTLLCVICTTFEVCIHV